MSAAQISAQEALAKAAAKFVAADKAWDAAIEAEERARRAQNRAYNAARKAAKEAFPFVGTESEGQWEMRLSRELSTAINAAREVDKTPTVTDAEVGQ